MSGPMVRPASAGAAAAREPPRNAGMAASRLPFQNSSRRLKPPVFCPNTRFNEWNMRTSLGACIQKAASKVPKTSFPGCERRWFRPAGLERIPKTGPVPGLYAVAGRFAAPITVGQLPAIPPRWSRCWQEVIRPGGFGPIPRRIWLCWCRRVGIRLLRGHPLAKKRGRGGKPSKKCPRVALFSFHPFLERDRPNSLALVPRPVK